MPRVTPLTAARKASAQRLKQTERMRSIISSASRARGYRHFTCLANAMGIDYQSLMYSIRYGRMTALMLGDIADFLNLDNDSLAACIMPGVKCRYDPEWDETT